MVYNSVKKIDYRAKVIMLPVEILHIIAAESPQSYRALLSVPLFARSLDPGTIIDYKIRFGHSVRVTSYFVAWYRHSKLHRLDGPAVEYINGRTDWHQDGRRHRVGEPAIIYTSGRREWWQNGRRHRLGGPAVEYMDGTKEWWQNGRRHRMDGPAVEYPNGGGEWYHNDVAVVPLQ